MTATSCLVTPPKIGVKGGKVMTHMGSRSQGPGSDQWLPLLRVQNTSMKELVSCNAPRAFGYMYCMPKTLTRATARTANMPRKQTELKSAISLNVLGLVSPSYDLKQ